MPPFIIPIMQAIAAAFAVDSLRNASRRYVPRPAPPSFAQSGGRSRPPDPPRSRTYPIGRRPVLGDRRVY